MSSLSRWALLIALSVALCVLFLSIHLPAAVLLGCMIAGILNSFREGRIAVPTPLFLIAQGVIGCLIARSLNPELLSGAFERWPLFAFSVLAVVGTSTALGWLLMRGRLLPGTTAVWGLAPGAASVMMLMSSQHDADERLVALMQYLRVALVTMAASAVSHIWMNTAPVPVPEVVWFPPVAWPALAGTLAIAIIGSLAAPRLGIQAGGLLVPMILAAAFQATGMLTIELPPSVLAGSYVLVGWTIGLRFTRPILRHAARALPCVLASILALIIVCMGFAALLVKVAHIDPLTAYLATSPGGADSVAIIAAASNVDRPFVMAMQMSRFLVVLFFGPALARFVAGLSSTSD